MEKDTIKTKPILDDLLFATKLKYDAIFNKYLKEI